MLIFIMVVSYSPILGWCIGLLELGKVLDGRSSVKAFTASVGTGVVILIPVCRRHFRGNRLFFRTLELGKELRKRLTRVCNTLRFTNYYYIVDLGSYYQTLVAKLSFL